MQLAMIVKDTTGKEGSDISSTGDMLSVVIKNLKQISRLLFPECSILSEWGFIAALRQEFKVDEKDNSGKKLKVKGVPCELNSGTGLILFRLIIEITEMIRRVTPEKDISLEVNYTRKKMRILFRYIGNRVSLTVPEKENGNLYANPLSIEERIRLINATLTNKKMNDQREELQLVVQLSN